MNKKAKETYVFQAGECEKELLLRQDLKIVLECCEV